MRPLSTPWFVPRLLGGAVLAVLLASGPPARSAPIPYHAFLDGPSEAPPNASPGTGLAEAEYDPLTHLLHLHVTFSGLLSTTTASHIHGPTAVAFSGTAGVMTTTPYFAGFPIGVTAGVYDNTLDLTQSSSFNPSFVTAQGSVAAAEAALVQSLADGKAYFNIHTVQFPGGEIRGFFQPGGVTPATGSSWGRIKTLYR